MRSKECVWEKRYWALISVVLQRSSRTAAGSAAILGIGLLDDEFGKTFTAVVEQRRDFDQPVVAAGQMGADARTRPILRPATSRAVTGFSATWRAAAMRCSSRHRATSHVWIKR
jgi:hypothetical protein